MYDSSCMETKDRIEEQEAAPYHLAHNETGRPEYKILTAREADRLDGAWTHDDLGDGRYDWSFCEDPENPTEDEELEACSRAAAKAWDEIKDEINK